MDDSGCGWGLGQFGDVASNILKSEGSSGAGGVASAEVADQAAGALGNALDAPRSNELLPLRPQTWYILIPGSCAFEISGPKTLSVG